MTPKKKYLWESHYPPNITWDVTIPSAPLFSVLDETAKKYENHAAINFYGKFTTYGELLQAVNRFAKGLQDEGITKGTKVGLYMPNCPHFIIAYYALLKIGASVVTLSPLHSIQELKYQVADTGLSTIITVNLRALHEKTDNLLQTTLLKKVIVGQVDEALPPFKKWLFRICKGKELAAVEYGRINVSFEKLMQNNGNYLPAVIDPEEDIAVYQYTGGTTGMPKAAMLTHKNLYANTVQTALWLEALEEGKENIAGILPLFHIFAMTAIMNIGVYKAATVTLYLRFDLSGLLKDIEKQKITILPAVPTIFSAINNYKDAKKYKLDSLKFCVSGGAPLPAEVKKTFEELTKCIVVEGYGLSETSPVVCVNPLRGKNKVSSVGLPVPGTVVEIRNPDKKNEVMGTGETGEVWVQGPQVMQGYYNKPEETAEVLKYKGVLTGDIGYLDNEGYVHIVDRSKEMIINGGLKIYPREIEEILYKHPVIAEAAVIGIKDEYKGEVPKVYIALKQYQTLTEEEVLIYLKGKIAKYKMPASIEIRQNLPKTMIGKINKKELVAENKNR